MAEPFDQQAPKSVIIAVELWEKAAVLNDVSETIRRRLQRPIELARIGNTAEQRLIIMCQGDDRPHDSALSRGPSAADVVRRRLCLDL